MRTLTLALLLTTPALAQPPAPPAVAPPTPAPSAPAAKPAEISPEAQAVFDRAVAAYKGAKAYRESVQTTLTQKASGLPKDAEPPTDQASTTTFLWGGADRFSFSTRDFSLFRNGKDATILVKAIGEYTQRELKDEDKAVFANMVDSSPTYLALSGGVGEPGKPAFGRFVSASEVKADELRGVKGKRISGLGLPPLPGFDIPSPVSMFFADESGLLMQARYDLKSVMQMQIDRNAAATGQPPSGRITIEQFVITSDWTDAAVDPKPALTEADFTFKPGSGDRKVDMFNMADGPGSVQHTLLNKPAPDISATTLDAKPWTLKDQRGKVVVLQFWASGAQMSTRSLATYNAINTAYADKGVVVVGVNQDHASMIEQTRRIAAAKGALFAMLGDGDKLTGNTYRVAYLPCTVIIDKEGVVRSITTDFDPADQAIVSKKLDKLLAGEAIDEDPIPTPMPIPPRVTPTAPTAPATPPSPEPSRP